MPNKSGPQKISLIYIKLKELLKKRDIKYNKLAEIIGYSPPTVANWFKGTSKIDVDTIVIIAQKLNVPIGYFFDNNECIPEMVSDKEILLKELIQEKNARIILLEDKIKLLEQINKKISARTGENAGGVNIVG